MADEPKEARTVTMQLSTASPGSGESSSGEDDDQVGELPSPARDGDEAGPRRRKMSIGKSAVFVPARAGLAERRVQELREVFGLFDPEGTGKVAPAEIRRAASEARLADENPEIWKMLAGLNADDPVDFEEFISLVTEPLGDDRTKSGVALKLNLLGPDAADKGSIGLEDLKRLATEIGIDFDDEDLEEMLEKAGAPADGRLGLDGFYSVLQQD
eukprot:gnl/TRDRNA2_/TRDRNA2_193110_c0_seq1.p1 gnl/TRDRNA2_/TRDRNA2_193110_c0~~gnl/TRDRNA2_/TRDRNA2_193110_c0_seq1.p1  ORF type:complete len:214 (-),score=68.26 gnl/TRDRNA2_/TRDRNA2_193110_c0_seq1:90-731(-)